MNKNKIQVVKLKKKAIKLTLYFTLMIFLLVGSSCKTRFRISVTVPPAILLNEETRKILLVNNVTQDNSPDKLITQALHGQAINGNVAAAEQSIIGLIRSFNDSRFLQGQAINPISIRNKKEINWLRIDSLCVVHQADAIIEIETFESDAPIGGTILANAAGQRSSPLRGWGYFNVYIPATREHLYRLEVGEVFNMPIGGNTNPIVLLNDMMRKREMYGQLGNRVGYSAGMMFYPNWIWVGRTYYNKGSAVLRRAKRPIRNGNWNIAEQILLLGIDSRNNKASGRSKYNLALVYEGQGRLEDAIFMAERAAAENGTRLAFDYINILRRRLHAQPRIVLEQD